MSLIIYPSKQGASSLNLVLLSTGTSFFASARSLQEGAVADRWRWKSALLFIGAIMVAGT